MADFACKIGPRSVPFCFENLYFSVCRQQLKPQKVFYPDNNRSAKCHEKLLAIYARFG
jgi:hypothetical protein